MKGIPRKITKDECSAFNLLAQEYKDITLPYNKLVSLLEESGINNARVFINKMMNYTIPIIIKNGRGKYKFNSKPVYIEALQNAWDYKVTSKEKDTGNTLEDEIENAILLLSDNGYKVLRRIFDAEAALRSPEKPVSSFITWEEVL